MAKRLYTNNANTTLAAPITNLATTLSVVSGSGSLFPLPSVGAGQSFVVTLNKAGTPTIQEIVIVTQRAGDIFTITRGAENTTALSWNAGDFVSLLPTAGDLALMAQIDDVQAQAGNYALDTGTANVYVVSLSPALSGHIIGAPIRFKASNTNTTSCTFNDGAGAAVLIGPGNSPLLPGQIIAGTIYTATWDGIRFELAYTNQGPTPAETSSSVILANYNYPLGYSGRFGMDPTGATDIAATAQQWLNSLWAMFYYQDGQGLWNGGGAAMPIGTLLPGKYQINSGSLVAPTGCTVAAMASPANTANHTRIIKNSTGITPARTWTANTFIPIGGNVQATAGGQLYYFRTNASGFTGSTVPAWPISGSVNDGGLTWANQGLCTAGDNRNTPIFKFSRATHPGGNVLANQNCNNTLQWLEFWSVTFGNTFSNPLSTLGGSSPAFGDYPNGGALFIDCDVVDTRFRQCVFQNTPCGINIQNVKAGIIASDGFTNGGSVSLFIEECEFDSASAHIIVKNSNLDLTFRNCDFYDGVHQYIGCTGKVFYDNCRWYGVSSGQHIDANFSTNSFQYFGVVNCRFEQQSRFDNINIYGAAVVDIRNNAFYQACTTSTIVVWNCTGGGIIGNTINDSGFQAAPTTGLGCTAAIKMVDCRNILVTANNITATDASTYGGFGIITLVQSLGSSGNYITGNSVTATYNGAAYNGQGRSINIASNADIIGTNYNANQWLVPKEGVHASTRATVPFGATMTLDARNGNSYDITFTNTSAWSLGISNPSEGQVIMINLINNSGGNLGTGTFAGNIKISNAGPFSLANGGQISFCLEYQGTWWYERWRAGSPTPN